MIKNLASILFLLCFSATALAVGWGYGGTTGTYSTASAARVAGEAAGYPYSGATEADLHDFTCGTASCSGHFGKSGVCFSCYSVSYTYYSGVCTLGATRGGIILSTSQVGGLVCPADNCAYVATSTTNPPPIAGYFGTTSSLSPAYAVTYVNTGSSCSAKGIGAGTGASLVDNPNSGQVQCPSGQVLTVTGTTGTCTTATSTSVGAPQNAQDVANTLPGGSGAPGSASNPMNIDKSGLATDSGQATGNATLETVASNTGSTAASAASTAGNTATANTKLDTLHSDNATTQGKLDTLHNDLNNAPSSDAGLATEKTALDNAATDHKNALDALGARGQNNEGVLSYSLSNPVAQDNTCSDPSAVVFTGTSFEKTITITGYCAAVLKVRLLFAWLLYILTAYVLFDIVTGNKQEA